MNESARSEFKLTKDGRLIIEDLDSFSKRSRKRKNSEIFEMEEIDETNKKIRIMDDSDDSDSSGSDDENENSSDAAKVIVCRNDLFAYIFCIRGDNL